MRLHSAAISKTCRRSISDRVAHARSPQPLPAVGTICYFDGPPTGRVLLPVSVPRLRCEQVVRVLCVVSGISTEPTVTGHVLVLWNQRSRRENPACHILKRLRLNLELEYQLVYKTLFICLVLIIGPRRIS